MRLLIKNRLTFVRLVQYKYVKKVDGRSFSSCIAGLSLTAHQPCNFLPRPLLLYYSTGQMRLPLHTVASNRVFMQSASLNLVRHLLHQKYWIFCRQVMQKKAAHHNIILGLWKRLLQRVAKCEPDIPTIRCRSLASRKSDGSGTDVAAFNIHCNPRPFSSLRESNGEVSTAGGNVQNGNRTIETDVLEISSNGSPDCQISPTPPVDPP